MSVSRHAARALRSLRSERRTLEQGLVALALSTVAGFAAGLILAHLSGTLEALPGLVVLIPAAVGMRGTIFGAVGARLGTSIHAGTYQATLRRGGVLRDNAAAAALTTLTSSLWLAALARLVAPAFGGSSISFWQLVTISVVGGALGSGVIMLVTIAISALSFRWGWDLDAVGTPMVTSHASDTRESMPAIERDVVEALIFGSPWPWFWRCHCWAYLVSFGSYRFS